MTRMTLGALAVASLLPLVSRQALAQGQSETQITTTKETRTNSLPFRVIPVAGAASFNTRPTVDMNNFNNGFAVGVFADFGEGPIAFETGVISLNTRTNQTGEGTRNISVNSWGVPILAKFHLGIPNQGMFAKLGGMPFSASGDASEFNVMAVGGIGGHIPLSPRTSIVLEGTYNRLFSSSGSLTDYQGVAFLGGLSLSI